MNEVAVKVGVFVFVGMLFAELVTCRSPQQLLDSIYPGLGHGVSDLIGRSMFVLGPLAIVIVIWRIVRRVKRARSKHTE
jgi:hypothetical protein